MTYIYTLPLERFLRMGDSSFVLGQHYALVMEHSDKIIVELSNYPGEVVEQEHHTGWFEFQPVITVRGWKVTPHIATGLKKALQKEIERGEVADGKSFFRVLELINEDTTGLRYESIPDHEAYDRYGLPELDYEMTTVVEITSGSGGALTGDAVTAWITDGDPAPYLDLLSSNSTGTAWQDDAFKDPAFVALLADVKDVPGVTKKLGKQAETLYRRVCGRTSGQERPLHHLSRFASNIRERQDAYVCTMLEAGVEMELTLEDGADDPLDQVARFMSFTFPQDRPLLELRFGPLEGFSPEALTTHADVVTPLLTDFYMRVQETLAFFHELGTLMNVQASVEHGRPVFRFRLRGNPAPSVPYAEDDELQTDLLLNLGQTFFQRRMLHKIDHLLQP